MQGKLIKRLNWGCGQHFAEGWINSDRQSGNHIDLRCDILEEALPLDDQSIDSIMSVHALQEIPLEHIVPVLQELRRVLKPGGVLRLCLPDADKAIDAYLRKQRDYFVVPDEDFQSLGGKLAAHILWYGHSKIIFTRDLVEELLLKAGFSHVHQCEFQQTYSNDPRITELDNREHESLFIEAVR